MRLIFDEEVTLIEGERKRIQLKEMVVAEDTELQIDYAIQKNEFGEIIPMKITFRAGSSTGFFGKPVDLESNVTKFDMLNDKPGLIDAGNEYLFLDVISKDNIVFFLKIYVNEKSVFMKS